MLPSAATQAPTVGRGDAGSLTRCFAAPNPWTTDLPKPILAACVQGCSPPPRLSVRVAPRCASACAGSSPVCRCPVSQSSCLSAGGTQCRPDQAGRICSQHSCCDATTLKDFRATGCIPTRSGALRATGALLSNHTATRRVGSCHERVTQPWLARMLTAAAPARLWSAPDIGNLQLHA